MPGWDGNGNFTRNYDWTDDRDSAIKVQASRFDLEHDTFAAGIQACLAKNGENAATADLDLGTYRYTNAGQATARTDLLRADQLQDGDLNYAVAGGTADAITVTLSPSITAYTEGPIYVFRPSADNATTTPTLNISGVGAKTVKKYNAQALVAADIKQSRPAFVSYDAGDDSFALLNPASAANFVANAITASSADTLTNKTLTSPTINSGALSGTLSGNVTASGNWDHTGELRRVFGSGVGDIDITADYQPGDTTSFGRLRFIADNDAGTAITFAQIVGRIQDDAAGSEEGMLQAWVENGDGSLRNMMQLGTNPSAVAYGELSVNNLRINGTVTGFSGLTAGTALEQSPIANNTSVTQAHGLGAQPDFVVAYFECLTAEGGYSVGDRIQITGAWHTTGSSSQRHWIPVSDGTNIVLLTDSGYPEVQKKSSPGSTHVLTAANWKYVAVPYLAS